MLKSHHSEVKQVQALKILKYKRKNQVTLLLYVQMLSLFSASSRLLAIVCLTDFIRQCLSSRKSVCPDGSAPLFNGGTGSICSTQFAFDMDVKQWLYHPCVHVQS